MTDLATHVDDGTDAAWWFRDGAGRSGPVSTDELRRLAEGPLGPATLVWRKAFGERWKRLDEALGSSGTMEGPPSRDYGRWTRSFEAFEVNPDKKQFSWLGIFGVAAYLGLGMWRRALVLIAILLAWRFVLEVANVPPGHSRTVMVAFVIGFAICNLKRDYYRHRVLGETMWRPMRFMTPAWACGGAVAVLALLLIMNAAYDPAGAMVSQVAGVWQSDGINVVVDVEGDKKTVSFDGKTYPVAIRSFNDDNETIVFQDTSNPSTLITLQKIWDDKHESFQLALILNDRLLANLLYVRPV